ncbi:hypothetical protein G6F56_011255 [Rhizopus delemar]|nr:hypothetical protein G6F56_011255 [Rhizopus delemar]
MMLGWFETIFDYSFSVTHCPGIDNLIPDALSRLFSKSENKLVGGEKVNAFQEFPYDIKETYQSRRRNVTHKKKSKSVKLRHVHRAVQKVDYMTPPEDERYEILHRAHLLGHYGADAMVTTVHHDNLHWTNIKQDALDMVSRCIECQAHNIGKHGYHPQRSITADSPGDHWAMDLGTFDITSKSGNNYILILVDIFSRFTILRAIPDKTAMTIANELADVFCLFGFPKVIQSDNGSEFKNELVGAMLQCTGIDHRLSLPYNPLGNNVAESYIGIAKKTIIKKLQGVANEWDFHVRGAQYAMNCKYARVHSSRPFAVMFNRQPNEFKDYSNVQLGDSSDLSADVQKLEEKIGHMNNIVIPSLRKRMEERRQVDHEKFNKKNRVIKQKFPLNSKVMILNVEKKGKVDPIYEGPFYVHGITKNGSYTLRDPANALLTRDVPTHHINYRRT